MRGTLMLLGIAGARPAFSRAFRQAGAERLSINALGPNNMVRRWPVMALALGVLVVILAAYLWKVKQENNRLDALRRISSKLFSIVGHDLKGPTSNTMQLLSMLETEDITEEEFRRLVPELKKQTRGSLELLDSLVTWGKTQLQGLKVRPETVVIKPIVQRNIDLAGQSLAHKKITIKDHVPADLRIYADPHHFDFILRNLLSNAIKFSFDGSRVDIHARSHRDQTLFSITDMGIGIGKVHQVKFLKTNLPVSYGTRGERGHGLGLLLIKEFVKANRGRIWVESQEGKGSTFYFSLPTVPRQGRASTLFERLPYRRKTVRGTPTRPAQASVRTVDPRPGSTTPAREDGHGK